MTISRSSRLLTSLVALLSMLCMQFALASYACPAMAAGSGQGATLAQVAMMDMSHCQDMDALQPQLCHLFVHGDLAKQSPDKTATPDVQPFVPVTLVLDLQFVDTILIADALPARPIALTRTTAPPLAIRNCCLRI